MIEHINLHHLKNKVFYSQNREDILLEAFFPSLKDGFYVDVGGYDPDYDSVTKLFYLKGWRGINVEPQPKNFERFKRVRTRDINIQCGVSNKAGKMKLRSYKNGGLSTFSDEMKNEYDSEPGNSDTDKFQDISVPVKTLEMIFKEHDTKQIHFMKVDVEGLEYEVLSGNDWNTYRPMVLCIEANHIVKDWHEILERSDYKLVFFDGLNEYFVDKHAEGVTLDYVDHIIMRRGGGVSFKDYSDVVKTIKNLRREVKRKDKVIEGIQAEHDKLNAENAQLHLYLQNPTILARKAARLTINKIKRAQ